MTSDPSAPATKGDLAAVEDRLSAVDDRLSAVEDRLSAVDDRLSAVEDRLSGVDDRLSAVDSRLSAEIAAVRGDVSAVEDRLTRKMDAMRDEIILSVAGEIARATNVMFERMTDQFRAGDDKANAILERVVANEQRLDRHIADERVHRKPRR